MTWIFIEVLFYSFPVKAGEKAVRSTTYNLNLNKVGTIFQNNVPQIVYHRLLHFEKLDVSKKSIKVKYIYSSKIACLQARNRMKLNAVLPNFIIIINDAFCGNLLSCLMENVLDLDKNH